MHQGVARLLIRRKGCVFDEDDANVMVPGGVGSGGDAHADATTDERYGVHPGIPQFQVQGGLMEGAPAMLEQHGGFGKRGKLIDDLRLPSATVASGRNPGIGFRVWPGSTISPVGDSRRKVPAVCSVKVSG